MQEEKRRILTKEKIREHFLRSMAVELALMILLIVLAECEQTDGVAFRFPRFGEEPRVAAL